MPTVGLERWSPSLSPDAPPPPFARPAVAVGVFDAVHLGHQALLRQLVAWAGEAGVEPVVLTFWPHPRAVLHPGEGPPLVCGREQRLRLLEGQGVKPALMRFDPALAALDPEQYARRVLVGALGASRILVGRGHRFGRERRGDVALLRRLGEAEADPARRFEVREADLEQVALDRGLPRGPVESAPVVCSSTAVREALRAADVARAARLLGRPYALLGRVVEGDRRGRTIGFPTANLDLDGAAPPPRGVWAMRARVEGKDGGRGEVLPAVANVGRRPTFTADQADLVEVHLLEGGRDLYGQWLEVEPVVKLRDEQRFAGVDALRAQIARDCEAARSALG